MEQKGTTKGTAQGTILGTFHYMSPEQVEGRDADHRSDLWSLGVVIYEMVSGRKPFAGDTAASVIGAILKDTPPALSERQPLVPASLERLITACLRKDPEERWQSAADLKRELEWIASGDVPRPERGVSRRRWPVALALAAGLLLGAPFAYLWQRQFASSRNAPQQPDRLYRAGAGGVVACRTGGISVGTAAGARARRADPGVCRLGHARRHATCGCGLSIRRKGDCCAAPRVPPIRSGHRTAVVSVSLPRGTLKWAAIDDEAPPQSIGRVLLDSRGGAWGPQDVILIYGAKSAALNRVDLAAAGDRCALARISTGRAWAERRAARRGPDYPRGIRYFEDVVQRDPRGALARVAERLGRTAERGARRAAPQPVPQEPYAEDCAARSRPTTALNDGGLSAEPFAKGRAARPLPQPAQHDGGLLGDPVAVRDLQRVLGERVAHARRPASNQLDARQHLLVRQACRCCTSDRSATGRARARC